MDLSRLIDLPVVDSHVHFWAIESTQNILGIMREARYYRVNVVSIISRERVNFNPEALYLKAKHPSLFYGFGGLDYSTVFMGSKQAEPNLPKQVDNLIEMGFDGIKMVEGKPTFRKTLQIPFDSDFYKEYFTYVESLGFPILFHVNDPEEFWNIEKAPKWAKEQGWFYDETYPTKEQLYMEVENVLNRCPNLKVIFAHFWFLSADLESAARLLDKYGNAHLDLTPGVEMFYNFSAKLDAWRNFFLSYQDRLVYGTDISSGQTLEQAVSRAWLVRNFLETDEEFFVPSSADSLLGEPEAPLKGMRLPRHVLEKIYAKNFERIAGKKPKELNPKAAIAECKRIGRVVTQLGKMKPEENSALRIASLLKQ
jgi:predicted TIM-barrel fold metal-dependent hydrolase